MRRAARRNLWLLVFAHARARFLEEVAYLSVQLRPPEDGRARPPTHQPAAQDRGGSFRALLHHLPLTGKYPGAALPSSARRCQGLHLIREAELKNSNGERLLPGQNLVEMRARLADLVKERQRLLKQYRMWRSKGGGAEFVPHHHLHWVARIFARKTEAERNATWFSAKGRVRRGPPCPRACAESATCSGGTKCPLYRSAAKDLGEGSEAFSSDSCWPEGLFRQAVATRPVTPL